MARNTQLILAGGDRCDPRGRPNGRQFVLCRSLPALVVEAEDLITEVHALGGMTKAVESGMPKLRIEEAAAADRLRIDRGEDAIVGVNKYQSASSPIEVRDIDNSKVRERRSRSWSA